MINDNSGFLTLLITVMVSISVFLLNLFLSRYEMGYSSFFGLKKTLSINFDFIGIFFVFVIILLIFVLIYLTMNPQHLNVKEENGNFIRSNFSIQILLTLLIFTVLYLYLLTKLSLTSMDVFKCVILPALPLFAMVYITLVPHIGRYIVVISTILLTFITLSCAQFAVFDTVYWIELFKFTGYILLVSGYLSGVRWIVNKIEGKKDINKKNKDTTSIKLPKWPLIHVSVIMIMMIIPITTLLIIFTSTGLENAERTSEVYMTTYNDKEYILFEQTDYYIALPIKKIDNDSKKEKKFMKLIGSEYMYLKKENILVRLIKIDKIEKNRKDNSITIEVSSNVE